MNFHIEYGVGIFGAIFIFLAIGCVGLLAMFVFAAMKGKVDEATGNEDDTPI